jgi:hypothetical protein
MQAAIDAHLVRRVRVALQPWQALIGQCGSQRPGGVIEACGAAEVEHTQLLNAGATLLADQLAAALHVNAHFDLKIRRMNRRNEYNQQAHDYLYIHCAVPCQRSLATSFL